MSTYLLRRLLLMIPTLFGVTVVSFCIMQLAPGDPLSAQLGSGGAAGQSNETREAYLVRKRDLKLDKPLLLNFNFFRDFSEPVRIAAYYRSLTAEEIAKSLPELAAPQPDSSARMRLDFLRSLEIPNFQQWLADPEMHLRLADAIVSYVQIWCEDMGEYAVPATMQIVQDADAPLSRRIGAIRALTSMVAEPFIYTFPRNASEAQIEQVTETWRIWWDREKTKFPAVDDETKAALEREIEEMAALESRRELFDRLDYFSAGQIPFFAELLFSDAPTAQREIAAMLLRKLAGSPLRVDVPLDADREQVQRVAENWQSYYDTHHHQYQVGLGRRLWYIVADTQYAHMVWRLVTFDFGRSTLKTREPVSEKLWNAFLVSAPLMLMAQIVNYLVAVPLGVMCAVNRGGWSDRAISLGLFVLYSIPPFVAGMLMLLFFCYGGYLKIFPMMGLHSADAEQLSWPAYLLDYFWHATLPVLCLSIFSLASMAMYSRSAMLDVIRQDYIRTAYAKGASRRSVIFKHAFRNSLIPIITLFASFIPALLGGSVLIEYLFGIPGMGKLGWESITYQDYPTIMALIYINAIVVMLSIILSDLLYVVADPRISFESKGK